MGGQGALAIIAGRGALPRMLADAAEAEGRRTVFAEMAGHPADLGPGREAIPYRVEKLGAFFGALREAGVDEVVFAGGVPRPKIDPTKFDLKTVRLAPKFLGAIKGGDDGLLRTVVGIFEGEGFRVCGAHEVAAALLPPAGMLTKAQPDAQDKADAARGAAILRAMAAADLGQAAIVAQGQALGVEAAPGTDCMLAQVAALPGGKRPDPAGGRGVFVKAPKAGQDLRMDLPAIGPDTVRGAAAAGLAGLVIEAGGVMVLERAETIAAADAAGLFLWVRPVGEGA